MESLRELYKIGRGPSSSHSMGPAKACEQFLAKHPDAARFSVTLYGSLAATGQGHGTDRVIEESFAPIPCEIIWNKETHDLPHPNTMDLTALDADGKTLASARALSVGGGNIRFVEDDFEQPAQIYPHDTFREIADLCEQEDIRLWEYVERIEGGDIRAYLQEVWEAMQNAIHRGIHDKGELPGGLHVQKKAGHLRRMEHIDESPQTRECRMLSAYAFAVSEQNADGETIVTAPTCGAAGVLPAVLYYERKINRFTDAEIVNALMTGGLIGNLIKTNASISGAECGCQAEIGTACAMAAAALGELFGLAIDKIEYAAEVAIEHHLGLTCDPIKGLVQIPCIERNAVAAMRAVNAVTISSFLSDTHKVSFDKVVIAMNETGKDIERKYRETSEGGLAKIELPGG